MRPTINLHRQITLRGEIRAATIAAPNDEPLPDGQMRITLLIDIDAQPRSCRRCGCTDGAACWPNCWWIDIELCSACAGTEPTTAELETIHRFETTPGALDA